MNKPKCQLTGTNGNVFALSGRVTRALKNAGLNEDAEIFQKELNECQSYDEALRLMHAYVDVQ